MLSLSLKKSFIADSYCTLSVLNHLDAYLVRQCHILTYVLIDEKQMSFPTNDYVTPPFNNKSMCECNTILSAYTLYRHLG